MITNAMQSKFGYEWGQQFTPPRSFEFAGRTISLRFENLDAKAEFTDDTHVIWTADRGREETSYFCLKSTDRVYLIAFGFQGDRCITLIIDTEASLATLHETSFDAEKRPYTSAVLFGTLDNAAPATAAPGIAASQNNAAPATPAPPAAARAAQLHERPCGPRDPLDIQRHVLARRVIHRGRMHAQQQRARRRRQGPV